MSSLNFNYFEIYLYDIIKLKKTKMAINFFLGVGILISFKSDI